MVLASTDIGLYVTLVGGIIVIIGDQLPQIGSSASYVNQDDKKMKATVSFYHDVNQSHLSTPWVHDQRSSPGTT